MGHQQVLFYYSGDGHWFLGDMAGGQPVWNLVSQSIGFGNLIDGDHQIWIGDFTGAGQQQALFYHGGDGHWFVGDVNGGQLIWSLLSQCPGFGNLLRDTVRIWIGDFKGAGNQEVLFYYDGDGHWFLGDMAA